MDGSNHAALGAEHDQPDAPGLLGRPALQGGKLDLEARAGLGIGGPSRREAGPEHRLTLGMDAPEDERDELGRARDQLETFGGEPDRQTPPVTTSV
jgi:hypothetical protein